MPIEARFHCNKRGMPDLLEGRISLAAYLEKLRGFWWHRVRVDGQPRGLYNLMRRADFDRRLERFEAGYPENPIDACRALVLDLLGPAAERAGAPGLVEMSSHNVKEAQTLLRLFPQARVIHALRDGRDAAASVTGKTWGPRRRRPARSTGGPTACARSSAACAAARTAPRTGFPRTASASSCSTSSSATSASATYADLLGFLEPRRRARDPRVLRRAR